MAKVGSAFSKSVSVASGPLSASSTTFAMVGFFDLLGFGHRVECVENQADLEEVIESLKALQRYFDFREIDDLTRSVQGILGKSVLAFSDSVITSVSLETRMVEREGVFAVLGDEIADIAYSQSRCVLDGHFIRGGVDYGLWYQGEDILVSPAMVGAYRSEQSRAHYPVVVPSERLFRLLQDAPERKTYAVSADPFPCLFREFENPNGEKLHHINYLRLVAESLDWKYDRNTYKKYIEAPPGSNKRNKIASDGYAKTLERYFTNHKNVVRDALRSATSRKIKSKYEFLAEYHNDEARSFLSCWTNLRIPLV